MVENERPCRRCGYNGVFRDGLCPDCWMDEHNQDQPQKECSVCGQGLWPSDPWQGRCEMHARRDSKGWVLPYNSVLEA